MFRAKLITAGVVGAGLAVGCTGLPKLPSLTDSSDTRAQVADDAADPDPFATVGQRTAIGNVEPIPVYGVGLAIRLHGTGSSPTQDRGGPRSSTPSARTSATPGSSSTTRTAPRRWCWCRPSSRRAPATATSST